jgi:polysaccharide pyruvyl transferase WcaK-like protein
MMALVGRLEALVSMRLHGLVFAAAQGVPALGLAYDPKVSAFALQAGQQALPLDQVKGELLFSALGTLRGNRAAGAPERTEIRAQLRAAAEQNLDALEQVLEELGAPAE